RLRRCNRPHRAEIRARKATDAAAHSTAEGHAAAPEELDAEPDEPADEGELQEHAQEAAEGRAVAVTAPIAEQHAGEPGAEEAPEEAGHDGAAEAATVAIARAVGRPRRVLRLRGRGLRRHAALHRLAAVAGIGARATAAHAGRAAAGPRLGEARCQG